ncbi:MAG: histidinol dehydrogenase [Deltaproteobacteria bacterium]|nr:histidinol dehydrogenase [Deltaproteobacteria bacterium]
MRMLRSTDKGFAAEFSALRARASLPTQEAEQAVRSIIYEVRTGGDAALRSLTRRFDGHEILAVDPSDIKSARKRVDPKVFKSLQLAFKRIESFHRRQLSNSWITTESDGEILGQLVRPLERVGIYVPGGKALYPSSVLMNAIPAKVAGVSEIIMVSPAGPDGLHPLVLAAADLCGISRIFQIGGAQAVAALAYGTESVPRVDKITGPGNIYVALAKKLVYGDVDIDMIAGPSEILIVADGSGEPAWVAADLLSQAEHDEMASSVLITTDEPFAARVFDELQARLAQLPRETIARTSIDGHGAIIIAPDLAQAVNLANEMAPEHLELFVERPWDLVGQIRNAGAVFMGHHTPEPLGDYLAGPNHVLPTAGSARFYSALSVDDFIKKISLLCFTPSALDALGDDAVRLAACENLDAHAGSVAVRLIRK